jgi:hypothetical protein
MQLVIQIFYLTRLSLCQYYDLCGPSIAGVWGNIDVLYTNIDAVNANIDTSSKYFCGSKFCRQKVL